MKAVYTYCVLALLFLASCGKNIDDLKNYAEVLSNCDNGSVVYLTRNGRGKYVVQSMLEYEKMKATLQLLADLSKGIESLRTEGGLTIEEAFEGLED